MKTRKILMTTLLATLALPNALLPTRQLFAQETPAISLSQTSSTTVTMIDKQDNTVYFIDNKAHTVTVNGQTLQIWKDKAGNIYLGDQLVLETIDSDSDNTPVQMARDKTWKKMGVKYYKKSDQVSIASFIVSMLGLVPRFGEIAHAIRAFLDISNKDEIYFIAHYFHNVDDISEIREDVYMYEDAEHTKLIDSYQYIHWVTTSLDW